MKEFIKRFGKSTCNVLGTILVFLLAGISCMLASAVVLAIVFVLPAWLLSFLIGDYAYLWFVVFIIGYLVWTERTKLVEWFKWQFIEPFKKNK